jgi:hypothetical protein
MGRVEINLPPLPSITLVPMAEDLAVSETTLTESWTLQRALNENSTAHGDEGSSVSDIGICAPEKYYIAVHYEGSASDEEGVVAVKFLAKKVPSLLILEESRREGHQMFLLVGELDPGQSGYER